MKQKDLLVIGLVGLVAAIISLVISGAIFGTPQRNPIKVPVVTKIDPNFPIVQNDDNYKPFFNSNALDPTQLIRIGAGNNTSPFQTGNQ